MDTSIISREEHAEFVKRMTTENKRLEDEDARQNKRLDSLETNMNQVIMQQLTALTTTIERLNMSVGNMLKEQAEIRERVKRLESRDGDMWRTMVKYVLSALVGGIIAFAFTRIGM